MNAVRLILAMTLVLTFLACNNSRSNSNEGQPQASEKPANPSNNNDLGNTHPPIKFESLGIIREFDGTDKAALFAVRSKSRVFKVTKVMGPLFLKTYMVGQLDQTTSARLFSKGSKPMTQPEREDLVSKFGGSTAIYSEGYDGNLCSNDEMKYEVVATGAVDTTEVEVAFQFEALPNPQGACHFHIFGIQVRSTN